MPFMMPNQQPMPTGMPNVNGASPNPSGTGSPNAVSIAATPMRQTGSRSPNTATAGAGGGGQQQQQQQQGGGQQQGPGPARSNTRGQSHFKPY